MRRLAAVFLAGALIAIPAQAQYAPAGTFGPLPVATFGGSGIPNNAVMTNTFGGVTLGLTATARFAQPTVTNNGAGTYYALPGLDAPSRAKWNFDFYVGGTNVGNYTYKLVYDFDPSINTPSAQLGAINLGNAAIQDSWNLGFGFLGVTGGPITAPAGAYNVNATGEYNFALLQYDVTGHEVGRVAMEVDVAAVPEPASFALVATGLLGLAAVVRRRNNA